LFAQKKRTKEKGAPDTDIAGIPKQSILGGAGENSLTLKHSPA